MEKRNLDVEEAARNGISTIYEQMPNGEFRYKLMHSGFGNVGIGIAGMHGVWQNSHYHKGVQEFMAVQEGWIAFVEMTPGGLGWIILRKGDTVISKPNIAPNVYVSAGTVFYGVKFGDIDPEKGDWYPSPELDVLVKGMSESEILLVGGKK